MIVKAEKGTFIRYDLDPQEESLKNGYNPKWENQGIDDVENTFICKSNGDRIKIDVEKGCYEEYYKLMAKAIKDNEPVPVLPKDGLEVIKIIRQIESEFKPKVLV